MSVFKPGRAVSAAEREWVERQMARRETDPVCAACFKPVSVETAQAAVKKSRYYSFVGKGMVQDPLPVYCGDNCKERDGRAAVTAAQFRRAVKLVTA